MGAATLVRALDGHADELSQVLALLRAAGVEDAEAMTLAGGDRRLLELHRAITSRDLEISAACPACGTVNAATLSEHDVPEETPRTAALVGGGLRQPTYGDLRSLPADEAASIVELLRRCTVGAPRRPPMASDFDLVDDALTGPLQLACAECGAAVLVDVDIQRLVLERLVRHGREIDIEIHLLASAYHWSLGEIEDLSDQRRSALAALVMELR